MMKKIGASLLEVLHLAGIALLFTMSAWVAAIPAPVRAWKGSGLATMRSEMVAGELQQYLLSRGPWIAFIAFFCAALAGFVRGDTKKLLPLVRIVSGGATVLFTLWASQDLPAHRLPHAWNLVFCCTSATLLLTAFMVGGGGKGAPKPSGGDK